MRWVPARALFLPLGGALAAALWPVRALEVVDLDRDRLVSVYPAGPFQLRYRHSVYGGLVWEQFTVVGTEILLDSVEAEQEAALEYYGLPQRVTQAAGRYRLSPVRQRLGELVVRATATGQRTLVVGRTSLPLYGEGREGHRVRLRGVRVPAGWLALSAVWKQIRERVKL
ncbi:MAG: DUF1850 domain-containing protein [Armatimonadota bacterium]|nr:DUF1850 domain-containing protein [Armatimonadota bacterium]